tara:strand:+ start:3657 stop:4067 length:411 start_codon:yes stop_codon:yes gene_type:complete
MASDISELQGLLNTSEQSNVIIRREITCRIFMRVFMILFAVAVLSVVIIVYIRVNELVIEAENKLSPHVDNMVDNVAAILNHTAAATKNAAIMSGHTNSIMELGVPMMNNLINTTDMVIDRLNRFSIHPQINIGTG